MHLQQLRPLLCVRAQRRQLWDERRHPERLNAAVQGSGRQAPRHELAGILLKCRKLPVAQLPSRLFNQHLRFKSNVMPKGDNEASAEEGLISFSLP